MNLDSGITSHTYVPFGIFQFSLFTSEHPHSHGSNEVFIISCHVLTLVDFTHVLCYSIRLIILLYNSNVGHVN